MIMTMGVLCEQLHRDGIQWCRPLLCAEALIKNEKGESSQENPPFGAQQRAGKSRDQSIAARAAAIAART
ncbi:hypothetical protein [Paraburkholderia piptadeniae]|uniref:hypothetical protein n=1 Tax=Paraburkholderia piptadeniae TaxID=1701573 RepID=UPI00117ED505|nr:hypothetical protein [Paraburkholderia piptadeniae]